MKLKLAILITCIFMVGCQANIRVESIPTGADVRINNNNFGKTPTRAIRIIRSFPIEIYKDGYKTYTGVINPNSRNPYRVDLEKKEEIQVKSGYLLYQVIADDKIILSQEIVHAETETIERSPNVKSVRKITNLQESSWLMSFSISSDGSNIIYSLMEQEDDGSQKINYSNLWTLTTRSGPVRRVTQGRYLDGSPHFSKDGQFVFFSSNRLSSLDIWQLSFGTGAGLALKTNSPSMHEDTPSLSSDGSTILFSSFVRGSNIKQIWKLNQRNNDLYQLREGQWPQWHTTQDKIIFSSLQRTTGEWKIWMMNSDGSNPIQISTMHGSNDIHPSVSPDGSKIIFSSDRGISSSGIRNHDIWIMGIDGSNPIQLTTNGSRDDMPIFSPDGSTVFFRSNRGVNWDIWALELGL